MATIIATATGPAQATTSRCNAAESRELARNQYARVLTVPRYNGMEARMGRGTVYCTYATGDFEALDTAEDRIYFGEAVHLNGRWLGTARTSCPIDFDPQNQGLPCSTSVRSEFVAQIPASGSQDRPRSGTLAVPGLDPYTDTLSETIGVVGVGSLRVRGRAIAFISCPSRKGVGRNRPDCTKPGTFKRVLILPTGASELQQLDQGRQIDAASLRLSGTRLTWRHNGQRRTATLS